MKDGAAAPGLLRLPSAELRAWRLLGAEVNPFLCAALAAQGETPDPKLLSLQHTLAELLHLAAPAQPEHDNITIP